MDVSTTTILNTILQNVDPVRFSWYDYILFSVMLGLSALIGIYFGCFGSKQATANEYLMGSKKMKVIPIALSLTASHISGITLLAVPAEVYRFGAAYWIGIVSMILVAVVTIYVFLPVFFKMQITSTYEYLERRFDNKNRMFASFLFAFTMFTYLPIVIYIPALAFSAATGINIHYITPMVCGVCIFYTTLGGLKAVVWTDALQFTVTLGALATVFILGVKSAGGIGNVMKKSFEGDRINIFDFDLDPTRRDTFWEVFSGMFILWVSLTSVNQGCVQKFLSVGTLREARLSVVYFVIGIIIVSSTSVFTGLIMYAKYADCDPFTTGAVTKNDQLLPYYVMDVAGDIPGLSGLFIAGVFCAGLSTLSAHLNCLSGTLYEDFISKWITNPTEKQISYILKTIVIITGIICTALVFIIEQFTGILPIATSAAGITSGPLLSLFTLGILFPKVSCKGAFYGCLLGLLFSIYFVFQAQYYASQGYISYPPKPLSVDGCDFYVTSNNNFTEYYNSSTQTLNTTTPSVTDEDDEFVPFYLFRISFYYHIVVGFIVSMFNGIVLSYILKNDDPPVSRDVLSPVIHFLLPEEEDDLQYYSVDKALKMVTINKEKN